MIGIYSCGQPKGIAKFVQEGYKYSSEYKCVLPSTSSVLEYFTVYKVDFLYTFDNQIIYMQNKEKYIYINVCIHFKY